MEDSDVVLGRLRVSPPYRVPLPPAASCPSQRSRVGAGLPGPRRSGGRLAARPGEVLSERAASQERDSMMIGAIRTVPTFLWCQICVLCGGFSSPVVRIRKITFRGVTPPVDRGRHIADGAPTPPKGALSRGSVSCSRRVPSRTGRLPHEVVDGGPVLAAHALVLGGLVEGEGGDSHRPRRPRIGAHL